ncbi:MAG: TIGR03086 family metal-binding protein [Acidimicrobiales bacterium]
MANLSNLSQAADEFGIRLAAVTPDDWDKATPCEGWTVRDLVNHAIAGNLMSAILLAGGTKDDASAAIDGDHLTADPVEAYTASVAAQGSGFAQDGAMERVVHHPAMDMPGEQMFGFRVVDLAVHAWDLARAIGATETLSDEVAQASWDVVSPLAPFIGQLGLFGEGPSGSVGDDAPLTDRVLDMVGRRP